MVDDYKRDEIVMVGNGCIITGGYEDQGWESVLVFVGRHYRIIYIYIYIWDGEDIVSG